MADQERVNGRDATQSDDGPSWRTRGRKASKGSELAKNNYSGYYTKEDMLSLYSPYFRPPNGFPSYDKVTSKTPLPPVALSAQPSEEDDEDDFSFSKGRGRGRGSRGGGRGGAVKSEYGWGKEEKGGRRSKPESPWKKGGDEEGFFDLEDEGGEFAERDQKFKSLLDEPIQGGGRSLNKKDFQSLLDEPIEADERQAQSHPKKPNIKSMLEAARRAKEAALLKEKGSDVATPEDELEIPTDIPKHHFELEESQAFFDIAESRSSKTKQQQPQTQQQRQQSQQQKPQQRQQASAPSQQQQNPHQQHAHQQQQQPQPGAFPFLGGPVPHSRSWFYRDPKGNDQGPFSSLQMEKWLAANYFTIELDVRSSEDPQYIPLVLHFLKEQRNPFSGMPLQQWFSGPSITDFQANVLQFIQHERQKFYEQQRQQHQMQQMMQQALNSPSSSASTPAGGPIFGPVKGGSSGHTSPPAPVAGTGGGGAAHNPLSSGVVLGNQISNPSAVLYGSGGPILGPVVPSNQPQQPQQQPQQQQKSQHGGNFMANQHGASLPVETLFGSSAGGGGKNIGSSSGPILGPTKLGTKEGEQGGSFRHF